MKQHQVLVMDLDEYLFFEYKKDKSFTKKKFAEKLGITHTHFSKILTGTVSITSEIAYKIEQLTNGEVSGWDLITSRILKKQELESKSSNFTPS